MHRIFLPLSLVVAGLVACGEPSSSRKGASALEIGGTYHVTGVTIGDTTGDQRPIQGRVVLTVTDGTYTTHFELTTQFPGTQKVEAHVVGTGEGTVEGHVLEGTASLQIVASKVPGVDAGFAMIPRGVSPRVVSQSTAEFFEDGSVRIHIRNEAAEGEDQYEATHTRLVGYRIEEL
jgi:hypothetical protein